MPLLRAHLLLMLRLLLAASDSAAGFTCTKPSTCQSAMIGYVVPKATTYGELISRFSPTNLHDLVAANQLPSDTAPKQTIPAKTTLIIPFRCRCTGNGVGQSDLYTAQNKFDDGSVTHQLEIVTSKNIADNAAGQKLWIPLPCSCDKVDGSDVTHFPYVVRSGDNTLEIAAKYGVPESTLLRVNNITNQTSLRQGRILDIPLQGMGTWSRLHYIRGYRTRILLPVSGATGEHLAPIGKVLPNLPENAFVGVLVGLLVAIILSSIFMTCYYWRSTHNSLSSGMNGSMQFDYGHLARATNSFSRESMIGEGKYGEVYKATYKGQEVAVKKLKTEGNTKELHRELQTVSSTRHTNLVWLMGWCGRIRLIDGTSCWKRIKVELHLVFEWIPNGNLAYHLHNREQILPWEKRYKIVKGIGSALRYLHHECNPCILHRDIKPDNILLDNHFNPKLADFGLSMITNKNGATVLTYAEGSNEYMDPQYKKYHHRFHFNRKLDVYSFGLVLLEIACTGKREKVRQMYGGSAQQVRVDDVADDRLSVFDRTEMEQVIFLGLKCAHPEEAHRPSMDDAMKFLEHGIELPATIEAEGGYSASGTVNEEAPMMPHDVVSSC